MKTKYSDKELLEFERNIKSNFIKYYYIGLLPLIIFSFLLLTNINEVLEYFRFIVLILIVWDLFSILMLNHQINLTESAKRFAPMKLNIGLLLASKLLTLFGIKLYLE